MAAGRDAKWLIVFGSTVGLLVSTGAIILFTFGGRTAPSAGFDNAAFNP